MVCLDLVYSLPWTEAKWLDSKAAAVSAKQTQAPGRGGRGGRGKGCCSEVQLRGWVTHPEQPCPLQLEAPLHPLVWQHPITGFCGACLTDGVFLKRLALAEGLALASDLGSSLNPSCQKSLSRPKWVFISKPVSSQEASCNRGHR